MPLLTDRPTRRAARWRLHQGWLVLVQRAGCAHRNGALARSSHKRSDILSPAGQRVRSRSARGIAPGAARARCGPECGRPAGQQRGKPGTRGDPHPL